MEDPRPLADGNGSTVGPAQQDTHESEENIFLFYPNLIGTNSSRFTGPINSQFSSRLLPHRPRHRFPLLHAASPPNLLLSLQRILLARRARRGSGTVLPPEDNVRSSA